MNLNTFLLIHGNLMLIGLPLLMIYRGKKTSYKLLNLSRSVFTSGSLNGLSGLFSL